MCTRGDYYDDWQQPLLLFSINDKCTTPSGWSAWLQRSQSCWCSVPFLMSHDVILFIITIIHAPCFLFCAPKRYARAHRSLFIPFPLFSLLFPAHSSTELSFSRISQHHYHWSYSAPISTFSTWVVSAWFLLTVIPAACFSCVQPSSPSSMTRGASLPHFGSCSLSRSIHPQGNATVAVFVVICMHLCADRSSNI